jgi:hypothetical protein
MRYQLCLATETNGVFRAETLTQAEQGAAVVQAVNKTWYQEQGEREKCKENVSVAKMLEDRLRNRTRLNNFVFTCECLNTTLKKARDCSISNILPTLHPGSDSQNNRQCELYWPSVWNSLVLYCTVYVLLEWGEASPSPQVTSKRSVKVGRLSADIGRGPQIINLFRSVNAVCQVRSYRASHFMVCCCQHSCIHPSL